MKKVYTKSIEHDALQFDPKASSDWPSGVHRVPGNDLEKGEPLFALHTPEGPRSLTAGDWIVIDKSGRQRVYHSTRFSELFDDAQIETENKPRQARVKPIG